MDSEDKLPNAQVEIFSEGEQSNPDRNRGFL